MGVLNLTPDSFSDSGKYFGKKVSVIKAVEDAVRMEKDGADFIDVGGESTRPGAVKISVDEELERVLPVICMLRKRIKIPISIDTYKSKVAEEALKSGAEIINDISGFRFDKKMAETAARRRATVVLMHIKGTPKDMQINPAYGDVVKEVYQYLFESIQIAKDAGLRQIIIDPGIGFGKTLEHNIELITELKKIKKLGYPILIGTSRKSFIDRIHPTPVEERLEGTIAANVVSILNGANIIRVHDVLENVRAAKVADRLK